MGKRYQCSVCKKSFADKIVLTRHIRACKSGKLARGSQTPVCAECGKKMKNWASLGAHRWRSHGVVGVSRKHPRGKASGAPGSSKPAVVDALASTIAWHRAEAARHEDEASRIEALAKEVKAALA